AEDLRCLALFHRPHPHALEAAEGLPEECAGIAGGLHPRARSALGAGADRGRELQPSGRALLDEPLAPRPGAAGAPLLPGRAPRSPARPNPIAMSVVRLVGVDGSKLSVVGLDCLDDTPLIDIKPYFASTDAVADAVVGWHAQRQQ